MTTLKLSLWFDTGFQDGGVEVPSIWHELDEPDFVFEDLHPSRSDLFSTVKLEAPYIDLMNCSYLKAEFTTAEAETFTFFGWIDDVAMVADSETPMTSISWHIDLWRTYLKKCSYGAGLVTRRPGDDTQPPNPVDAIWNETGSVTPLFSPEYLWACVSMTYKIDDEETVTGTRTAWFPVSASSPSTRVRFKLTSTSAICTAPSMADFISGSFDEILGLNPDTLSSAFISPVPPWGSFDKDTDDTGTFLILLTSQTSTVSGFCDASYVTEFDGDHEAWPTVHCTTSAGEKISDDWHKVISNHDVNGAVSGDIPNWKESNPILGLFITYTSHYRVELWHEKKGGTSENPVLTSTSSLPVCVMRVSDVVSRYANATFTPDTEVTLSNINGYGDSVTFEQRLSENGSYGTNACVQHVVIHGAVSATSAVFKYEDRDKVFYCLGDPAQIPYTVKGSGVSTGDVKVETGTNGRSVVYSVSGKFAEISVTFQSHESSDVSSVVLTGFDGAPCFTLPWGRKVTSAQVRDIVTGTSAYIALRFNGLRVTEGMEAVVPLPAVAISTNSLSSYLYSGEREFDRKQMALEAKNALLQGVTSSVDGGVSNAVMASIGETTSESTLSEEDINGILGHVMFPANDESNIYGELEDALRSHHMKGVTKNKMGIGKAGLASIGTGAIGSMVNYAVTTANNQALLNQKTQAAVKQPSSLIFASSGTDWLNNCNWLCLVRVSPDAYSVERWENQRRLNGFEVNEMLPDCEGLVINGGPLRIAGCVVGGAVPVPAKNYISNRLSMGVRMLPQVNYGYRNGFYLTADAPAYDNIAEEHEVNLKVKTGYKGGAGYSFQPVSGRYPYPYTADWDKFSVDDVSLYTTLSGTENWVTSIDVLGISLDEAEDWTADFVVTDARTSKTVIVRMNIHVTEE